MADAAQGLCGPEVSIEQRRGGRRRVHDWREVEQRATHVEPARLDHGAQPLAGAGQLAAADIDNREVVEGHGPQLRRRAPVGEQPVKQGFGLVDGAQLDPLAGLLEHRGGSAGVAGAAHGPADGAEDVGGADQHRAGEGGGGNHDQRHQQRGGDGGRAQRDLSRRHEFRNERLALDQRTGLAWLLLGHGRMIVGAADSRVAASVPMRRRRGRVSPVQPGPRDHSRWLCAAAALLVLWSLLWPREAEASRPVIPPGREADIAALFVPHALGDELAEGWTLHSFTIDEAIIHVWIAAPGTPPGSTDERRYAKVSLHHPDEGPWRARKLPGFAVEIAAEPAGSEAAVATLIDAVEANDGGSFWQVVAIEVRPGSSGRAGPGWRAWLALTGNWLSDGLVLFAALTALLLALTAHKLRGAEPWMKWTLAAIVLGGAALRLTLSPLVALAPWPYTRVLLSARMIYESSLLGELDLGPAYLSEVIVHSTLAFALLAPLSVYVHARYLLDDHRAGLWAAGLVAVLPLHLRFSHSDTAFIPSITISSLVFALVHAATREPSRRWGWAAAVLLGFPLALMFQVRPLNIMYYPLILATAFVPEGLHGAKPTLDRWRTVVVFAVVTAVTFGVGVPWLIEGFRQQIGDGLSASTLRGALHVLGSLEYNALIRPDFTPPLLTALAVYGGVALWRRGRKRLFAFLAAWLLGFLVAHAYVIPVSPYMQARYHLHLIVPFMLLAVAGLDALLAWLLSRREAEPQLANRVRAAIAVLLIYLLASPLIHRAFIRETGFNDGREWLFVHAQREQVPEECTVIEAQAERGGARFARVGAYARYGGERMRFRSLAFEAGDAGPPLPAELEALRADPPPCLVWYQGLSCFIDRPPGEQMSALCEAIPGYFELEERATTAFESRGYDGNLSRRLEDGDYIELGLYRARPRER